MEKKSKKVIIIAIVVVAAIFAGVLFMSSNKTSVLSPNVNKTVSTKSNGYRLDLRIYGEYNSKKINNIITVSNYKDEDKTITVSNLVNNIDIGSLLKDNEKEKEQTETYIVKGKKYYRLKDEKLEDTESVPYLNSDIYLNGLNSLKDVKQTGEEKIAENTYKVYKGKVSKKVINQIASTTEDKFEFDKDCDVEVWLSKEDYVYKVYYRVDKMTFYASYFAIGKTGKINLDEYKKDAV